MDKIITRIPIVTSSTYKVSYTNWRGDTAIRVIYPLDLYYGTTHWHSDYQWFLLSLDIDEYTQKSKNYRYMAIKDMIPLVE